MNYKKDEEFILSSLVFLEEEELPKDFRDNVRHMLQRESKKKTYGFMSQIVPNLNWKYALAAVVLLLFVWTKNIIIPPTPQTQRHKDTGAQRVVNILSTPEKEKLLGQKVVHSPQPIRNLQSVTHNPQSVTCNPQPLISNQQLAISNQQSAIHNPQSTSQQQGVDDEKVLKIDIVSSEYLKNVEVKITFSENIIIETQDASSLQNEVKKDIAHLYNMPITLLLPVKYLDKKEGSVTLTFSDEERKEFAKYSYKLTSEEKTLQCLIGEEKEVLLTYLKDKNIPEKEVIVQDEKLSVSVASGDVCFAPVSYENALLVPNLEGRVEIIFANDATFDITNLQMMVF